MAEHNRSWGRTARRSRFHDEKTNTIGCVSSHCAVGPRRADGVERGPAVRGRLSQTLPKQPASRWRRAKSLQTASGLRNARQPHSLGLPGISHGPTERSRISNCFPNADFEWAIVAQFRSLHHRCHGGAAHQHRDDQRADDAGAARRSIRAETPQREEKCSCFRVDGGRRGSEASTSEARRLCGVRPKSSSARPWRWTARTRDLWGHTRERKRGSRRIGRNHG